MTMQESLLRGMCGAIVMCSAAALGAPVQLRLSAGGGAMNVPGARVEMTRATSPGGERQTFIVPETGLLDVDLAGSGVWYARPLAAGFWGETRTIVVPADTAVELRLWPAALILAELAPKQAVEKIAIHFQPFGDEKENAKGGHLPPTGSSDCDLNGRKVQCLLPAGRLDYSLRSRGYTPIFKWDQRLAPDTVVDLGTLTLRKGSSLLGRVVTPNATPAKPARVQVTLRSEIGVAKKPGDDERMAITGESVFANERGIFVFEGLSPGAYRASARSPGLLSEEREVTIFENVLAELREPLVLTPPLVLSVAVTPPTDPWRSPWTIELTRLLGRGEREALIGSSKATPNGDWISRNLPAGEYRLKVRREPQGVWHSQFLTVDRNLTADVSIPFQKVAGELKLGGAPLAGSIWFGGELNELSVPVVTQPDGTFKAILPKVTDNIWAVVDVVADQPSVRRTLEDVHLSGPDDHDVLFFDVDLPLNRIYGEVTTSDGELVALRATVYATPMSGGSPLQVEVDEGGVFSFSGLAADTYSVQAIGPDGKSATTNVTVDDAAQPYLKLVLLEGLELEGVVTSPHGAVSGARVMVYPEDRTGFGIVEWTRTDPEGRFRLAAPPQSPNVTLTVAAPGFAFLFFDVLVEPRQLPVSLVQRGGRIIVDAASPDVLRSAVLFSGRAFLAMHAFEQSGVASVEGTTAVLENVMAGPYDICLATSREAMMLARSQRRGEQCAGGFLPPGGELRLRLGGKHDD